MPNFQEWVRGVLFFSIFCHAILLMRLWKEGLVKPYPFLSLFVVADLAQSLIALPFSPSSTTYRTIQFASSPVIWLLAYLVVVELYRVILEDYPGISSAGRKAVTWCLLLAVIISAATAVPGLNNSQSGKYVLFKLYLTTERSVTLGLLLFLVLVQLFLARYRLRLSRNRIIYSAGYALYFGIGMAASVIAGGLLGVRMFGMMTISIVVIADLILLAGAFLLTRQGEFLPVSEMDDNSAQRLHLQQQLADMNRLLSRAARGR